MKLQFNFFCRDIEAQLAFYRDLLDLPEAAYTRSPIYRSVHTPDFQVGFHAAAAYALLGVTARQPDAPPPHPLSGYPTFLLDTPGAIDAMVARIGSLGGRVIQGPFATYYSQWQAVLADPEDHVFRVACEDLPEGITAPTLTGHAGA